ncbi:unnamed protein product [Caenorhabditis angaria]|uniref:acid phosphatase n=1 Tax=Caenorhabditis angaria TaxID=860376 RepID=A0A9P1N0W6_9PELO|nr:unnamed protein product [Caenorhabditis angaria]
MRFIIGLFLCLVCSQVSCVKKLLLIQAIYRHGERTPTSIMPNDYFTEEKWPGGFEQLTLKGQRQHVALGKLVREKYKDFLPEIPDHRQIYVRSTDTARTIKSAMANNLGMYPKNESNPLWPDEHLIPVFNTPRPEDDLLFADNPCELHDKVWRLAKTIPKVRKILDKPEIFANLTEFMGKNVTDANFWEVWSAIKCEKEAFPDEFEARTPWYNEDLWQKILKINRGIQDFQVGKGLDGIILENYDIGRTLKSLRIGTLLNDLNDRMIAKVTCNMSNDTQKSATCQKLDPLKFLAYSTHDTTIYALYAALHLDELRFPEYAAALYIELWQETEADRQTFFRIIHYRNDTDTLDNVVTRNIPECFDDFCDLSIFRNYSLYYQPDRVRKEWCDISSFSPKIFNFAFFAGFLLLLIVD